ncbi:serine/threonine-protein phosphatase 7 long form homolog [Primulina huaijiensis]|uniref:serine/threonine-protein phosphatase 7 long form homolog n=1 Tax=Primulina huaijiensis TaxID=1492673 RepID=UPI003CC79A58
MRLKVDLCGPVQILQIWVWSRITLLCPDRTQQVSMSEEHAGDVLQGLPFPPYGARWRRRFSWTHTAHHSVRIMRDMLDRMVEGQFLWTVYDMESPEVGRILNGDRIYLCRSACTLINFHIVEMHRPERCLRQFGMRQGIPPPATNFDNFHKLTRQGRNNFDWATYHKDFVEMWNDRYNFVIDGDYVIPGIPATRHHSGLYWLVSSHFTDSALAASGNEFEPGPSSSNMAYTIPPVVSNLPSYDAGYYTPIVGSFTQFLQSDFRLEGFEVGGNIADTSTYAGQTSTHGDDEQMLGRGRRVIRRPPCGTGGNRYRRH